MQHSQGGGLDTGDARTGGPARDAVALAQEGHVSEALAAATALLARDDLTVDDLVTALATALDCRLARGDVGDALGLGDRLAAYHHLGGRTGARARHAAGELAAALNDVEVAAEHFAAAGDLLGDGDEDARLVPWRLGAALSAVRLGRRREAAGLASEQHARCLGLPAAGAQALRTLAATEAGGGRVRVLREAAALLAPLRYGRLAAQVDTDLAGLLLLGDAGDGPGAADEAVVLLRRAEEYAGRHQLWPLQTRVRGLLDRAGEAAVRGPHEVLASLTGAERRVATLAAEGLTNRQAAGELGVSVKAVEWHLSHVYRKLGIRSRAGLTAAIGPAVLGADVLGAPA